MRKKLEEELQAERQKNQVLQQTINDQFKDLDHLEEILGKLETQVGGHEVVIQQQTRRIQIQEQTILQLNLRLQQYVAQMMDFPTKTFY